jgi:hypothetical protein
MARQRVIPSGTVNFALATLDRLIEAEQAKFPGLSRQAALHSINGRAGPLVAIANIAVLTSAREPIMEAQIALRDLTPERIDQAVAFARGETRRPPALGFRRRQRIVIDGERLVASAERRDAAERRYQQRQREAKEKNEIMRARVGPHEKRGGKGAPGRRGRGPNPTPAA